MRTLCKRGRKKGVTLETAQCVDLVNVAVAQMSIREKSRLKQMTAYRRIMAYLFNPVDPKISRNLAVFNNHASYSLFMSKQRNLPPNVLHAIAKWAGGVMEG